MTIDKQIVQDYFNNIGYERWSRIYSDSAQVSKVQLDIRTGHQRTVDQVLYWLKNTPNIDQLTVCDAGCGVGMLSVPVAELGSRVFASDISEKMIGEAITRSSGNTNPVFSVSDLESLTGSYDVLVCLDVLIHYPLDEALRMLDHLASLTKQRLIISFAPKNLFYDLLKRVGSLFQGSSKATRAYLHPERAVKQHLQGLGFEVQRQEFVATQFYFARLYDLARA